MTPDTEIKQWLRENRKPHGNSTLINWNGQIKTAKQWSKITGLPHKVILYRRRRGWTIEQTLTTPLKANQYT